MHGELAIVVSAPHPPALPHHRLPTVSSRLIHQHVPHQSFNMAFVSTFTPSISARASFAGQAVSNHVASSPRTSPVTMEAYSLDKYAKMNDDARPVPAAAPVASGTSKYWLAYRDSLKAKFNPFRGAKEPETVSTMSQVAVLASSTPYFAILAKAGNPSRGTGAGPDDVMPAKAADKYVAECLTNQYKAQANPAGVYSISCTEGASKLQAEESRELSLLNKYKQLQRTPAQKWGDFTEARRASLAITKGCSYEESLVSRFPQATKAMLRGYSEAKNMCVRYNSGISYVQNCGSDDAVAAAYMSNTVDMQYKQFACPTGVYEAVCSDGNQAGLADFKRVQAMSARFRANQMPAGVKAQAKYDAKLYARNVSRCCSYEEDFNRFPAIASSMRPNVSRY